MWAYEIFIPIAIVVGIGLVLGLVLAVAAIILHTCAAASTSMSAKTPGA